MAYLPKSLVEKNIKTRIRKDKNGNPHTDFEAYVGIDPFNGKPIRITRASEKDLSKALSDFYARHRTGGDAAVRLSATQAIDAKRAYDTLASAGMPSVSLFEAVSAYVNGKSVDNKNLSITVEEAYNDYLKRRFNYFVGKTYGLNEHDEAKNVIASLDKWVRLFGNEKISTITAKSILDYFESNYKDKRAKTYNHHLQYFKSFFNWCCREEIAYLTKSPAKTLAYKPEAWEEPKYMKPDDVLALFRLLEQHKSEHPEYLAYAIVNFFCGCRAIETQRMASDPDAAKINLEEEFVRVVKAKGHQCGKIPRAFQLHPTAVKWINSFDFESALSKVNGSKTQIELYKFAKSNGIPIFRNCGRHTFITYHVAAYGNPAITQAMVGTGGKMMANNYRGLATKKDGEAFFNILPSC